MDRPVTEPIDIPLTYKQQNALKARTARAEKDRLRREFNQALKDKEKEKQMEEMRETIKKQMQDEHKNASLGELSRTSRDRRDQQSDSESSDDEVVYVPTKRTARKTGKPVRRDVNDNSEAETLKKELAEMKKLIEAQNRPNVPPVPPVQAKSDVSSHLRFKILNF